MLVRYRPFSGHSLHDEVNRVFGSLIQPATPSEDGQRLYPACDLRENESGYSVRMELPGVSKEDINISLVDNRLVVAGEKKQTVEDKDDNWHHVERSYGRFERSFKLPTTVSSNKVTARFTDGVLEVSVPKAEEALPRQIKIDS